MPDPTTLLATELFNVGLTSIGPDDLDNRQIAERLLASGVVFIDTDQATEPCTCPSGDGSLRWPCPKHPPMASPTTLADARLRASIDDLETRPVDQRFDRLRLAHDEAYNALAALVEKLHPVLGPLAFGDDQDTAQPEPVPASPVARTLIGQTVQAEYLVAKVRAITAAVDL